MIIKVKNNKESVDTWCGMMIEPAAYYEIEAFELNRWQTNSKVLSDIGSGSLIVNNGSVDITDVAAAIKHLLDNSVKTVQVESQPLPSPFAAKTMLVNGVTKKFYKREHGIQAQLNQGSNTILFTIPYPWVKIIGLELLFGEKLDTVDLMILDSTSGTYSGVANYQLNQFGFNVNVAEGEYEEQNAYDADLYQGMQIKIVYNSQSAKTIGINFNLTEVKT